MQRGVNAVGVLEADVEDREDDRDEGGAPPLTLLLDAMMDG